jgi:hypothetical protein
VLGLEVLGELDGLTEREAGDLVADGLDVNFCHDGFLRAVTWPRRVDSAIVAKGGRWCDPAREPVSHRDDLTPKGQSGPSDLAD